MAELQQLDPSSQTDIMDICVKATPRFLPKITEEFLCRFWRYFFVYIATDKQIGLSNWYPNLRAFIVQKVQADNVSNMKDVSLGSI